MSTFCPCPETLKETEFWCDGLNNQIVEISRKINIHNVVMLGVFSKTMAVAGVEGLRRKV